MSAQNGLIGAMQAREPHLVVSDTESAPELLRADQLAPGLVQGLIATFDED